MSSEEPVEGGGDPPPDDGVTEAVAALDISDPAGEQEEGSPGEMAFRPSGQSAHLWELLEATIEPAAQHWPDSYQPLSLPSPLLLLRSTCDLRWQATVAVREAAGPRKGGSEAAG